MRRYREVFLSVFLALCRLSWANSPSWAINDPNDGWNSAYLTKMYFHNSELQRQWAWELLGKIGIKGTEIILDFGCGDGKITAEIARLVPKGNVIGIDISSNMIRFARIKFPSYAYPNLCFAKSDTVDFSDSITLEKSDIICSFCVFHLVPDPLEILKNLKKHLKENGKLILVIPAGKNPAFFQAANTAFEKYSLKAPWAEGASQANPMRTIEGAKETLQKAGFAVVNIEMVDTDNAFIDKEELIDWMTGTTSANWNIPHDLSQSFFSDLVDKMCYLDHDVFDQEGRLHFKLSRIHIIAIHLP